MKRFLKIVGVLFLAGIGIGAIWYQQSLKIEGEALLTACWSIDLYDDVSGEKVVGVEDLDFDPETGTIFMSAYDRRAVAREIEGGEVTTQGGIYTIKVSDITDAGTLQITDISRAYKELGNEVRPHGISFYRKNFPGLLVINRLFMKEDDEIGIWPIFENFEISPEGNLKFKFILLKEQVCSPNDLVSGEQIGIYISDDGRNCNRKLAHLREKSGLGEGFIYNSYKGESRFFGTELSFPNGMALINSDEFYLAVALTRDEVIKFYDPISFQIISEIELPIAPDNLTVDENDNLYVAGFPNLIDYYFYLRGWLGVEKSPSVAYRISPEDYSQELLFKDDGEMISGATVALRAGDYLILGSAWDDNIAICSGMDGLD